MRAPRALITGVAGQDGSYLAELLLEHGYEVFGIVRGSPLARYPNLAGVQDDLRLLQGDLLDQMTLLDAITRAEPDELYNLAATSFVPASWRQPVMTAQFTAVGVTSMLEAVRITKPDLRVYQASTSEIFGATTESPQNERTRFVPHNPYAVAKLYGHLMVSTYRERYGMHASSGILYNHESPRRPPEFVSRRVSRGAAAIKLGLATELQLGDLDARRDWSFAGDVAEAMWLMLQQACRGRLRGLQRREPHRARARADRVRRRRPRCRRARHERSRARAPAASRCRSWATPRRRSSSWGGCRARASRS